MEHSQVLKNECEYQELLNRLDKANEALSFYKSNKEICMRDLNKLELENSALNEENKYLKNKIKNVEKNLAYNLEKTSDHDDSLDMFESICIKKSKKNHRYSDSLQRKSKGFNYTSSSASHRYMSNDRIRFSLNSNLSKRDFSVAEKAVLQTALIFRL